MTEKAGNEGKEELKKEYKEETKKTLNADAKPKESENKKTYSEGKDNYPSQFGYYSYYYGYSYAGAPAGYSKSDQSGYYPMVYPFMPTPFSAPRQNYRKRIKGKDTEYASKYYSHLGRVNSPDFSIDFKNARFFVIKSLSEEDVHKAMKYQIWSSTPEGNKRLNEGFKKCQEEKSPLFLFYSVNGSGQFVGACKMLSEVNFSEKCPHWAQDGRWMGKFKIEWVFVKDISNREFKHILIPSNENKPVTNSRDAQEVPFSQGMEMLKIFKNYSPEACLLDEFEHYDIDEAKKKSKTTSEQFVKIPQAPAMRGKRGRGKTYKKPEGEPRPAVNPTESTSSGATNP